MRTGIGSVSRMSKISRRTWVNAAEKPSKRPSDGKVGGVDGVTTGVRGGELSDDMVRSVAVGVTNSGDVEGVNYVRGTRKCNVCEFGGSAGRCRKGTRVRTMAIPKMTPVQVGLLQI